VQCVAVWSSVLPCVAVCCSFVHGVTVSFSVLQTQQIATKSNTLHCKIFQHTLTNFQHTPTHCMPATHSNSLQHTATHCNTDGSRGALTRISRFNTMKHNATRCNTLQHTATHCNTLQHRWQPWRTHAHRPI